MIVVTAPTGDIGHQVVQDLLHAGVPFRVVARDPSRLTDEVRAGAEIVTGSHGDAGVVREAFDGASAVFWLLPPDPQAASVAAAYVDFTRPAAGALKEQGVKRVVAITALGRGSPLANKAGHVTGSLAMDDLIASTGVAFRGLANPSFMDNIARQAITIRDQGKFFSPISGDLRLPSVATRDIAAVAARWLLDDSWTGQSDVPVLGPEDISFNEMAEIISDVLGMTVTYQPISFDAYKARFLQFGMSDAMAQGMTDMACAKDQGLDLTVPRTPEHSTPTSFRQWCEDSLKSAVLG
ncbi:NmrA family transcriptional regulator [Sphingobium sp. C100]|uniref:NAD(P)H-binding protein n=1 Tax=Sphingobium sp. C100 TaxID=1207055 RepID=UPI0003D6921A|nr:NAD(P)H-binding protein [Sphingobium sp. C100]ETI62860.1 NmrA family transcriptional regulator [Sphingobium sp. C100]